MISAGAERILKRAVRRGLEDDHAVLPGVADPRQLRAPVPHAGHQAFAHVGRVRVADMHPDLVSLLLELQVEREQVVGIADPEESHALAECVAGEST
jgi:hypothetical protein